MIESIDEKLRANILHLNYLNEFSPTATLHACKVETGECYPQCTEGAIRNLNRKFENSSTIRRPLVNSDRIENVCRAVQSLMSQNTLGICSVCEVTKTSNIPKTSVHGIMCQELNLKPCRL